MQIFKNKIQKVEEFIGGAEAKNIKHIKGKNLLSHLVRVKNILEYYGCNEDTLLAGLCHSLYSTEYFKQAVLNINNRDILRNVVGGLAEDIIYNFCIMKRDTLFYNKEKNNFSFNNLNNEKCEVSDVIGIALAHIMLANDIDHIYEANMGATINNFKKYKNTHTILKDKARNELYKVVSKEDLEYLVTGNVKIKKEKVIFTGHSGINIKNDKISIAIDPWLYASYRETPNIYSLDLTQYTIDYMIPEAINSVSDISPDIICLSHFHTHHSPFSEIIEFAKIKPIKIISPKLEDFKLKMLREKVGDYIYNRIEFIFTEEDSEINIGQANVRVYKQESQKYMTHLMFSVQLGDTKIVHIVDAGANMENGVTDLDSSWSRFCDINPDYLFVGIAAHDTRGIKNGIREISELKSLSSVQAAKLAVKIDAKCVVPIGIYNHSVWDDRFEMGQSVSDGEAKLVWALSFLAPAIKIRKLLPGDIVQ